MNGRIATFTVVVTAMFALTAQARMLSVPDEYETIQSAINEAENSDTVLVAPGRYEETITFSGNNIVVAGTYLTTNDEDLIAETIIDGSVGNQRSVVAIRAGEGESAELAGFTITGGNTDYGGGVYCTGTTPYLHHLIIEDNHATRNGGGLYTTRDAIAVCDNLIIRNNSADNGGGGLTCYFSAVTTLEDCTISGNSARLGAGVQCSQSAELIMRRCSISENMAPDGEGAGGVWAWNNASVSMQNCSIVNNQHNYASAILVYGTNMSLDHVLVARNIGGHVIAHTSEPNEHLFQLSNVTIVDNEAIDCNQISLSGSNVTLANSILLGPNNPDRLVSFWNGSEMAIDYSLVEGGERIFMGDADWGEGNFDEDPLFIDRENGDYSLTPDSPCIDAGDPDAEPDPDGTRRDIGAIYFNQHNAWVGGRVVDGLTGEALLRALVEVRRDDGWIMREITTENGEWGRVVGFSGDSLFATISIQLPPYVNWIDSVRLGLNDSLFVVTEMNVGVLNVLHDTLLVGLVEGESTRVPIELRNDGNAPIIWSAIWQGLGQMNSTPGEILSSARISEITGDDKIQGVTFDGTYYYLAGANGSNANQIYVLDEQFNLIRQFDQMQISRYGMKDLEWDGTLIWGIDDSLVCGFSPDGELAQSFRVPYYNSTNIGYNPEEELFWISGVTSGFYVCNRAGEVQREIDRIGNMRIDGLGWNNHDPDGYNLIILDRNTGDSTIIGTIYRVNPVTLDTIRVMNLESQDGALYAGLSVRTSPANDGSTQILTTLNLAGQFGGDQLQVIQFLPNREWIGLIPTEGVVDVDRRFELDANILSEGALGDWQLSPGDYEAEIVLKHNGLGGEWQIPMILTVSPNASPKELTTPSPTNFGIISTYPQPFNSTLSIRYWLEQAGNVRLAILTLEGREVALIDVGSHPAGESRANLNAETIPSGVYLVKLAFNGATVGRKVVLVR